MSRSDVLQMGAERLRVRRWRDDPRSVILVPLHDGASISPRTVQAVLSQLAGRGVTRAYTAALAPSDQLPFRQAGFEPFEHLHLLSHDLTALPAGPSDPTLHTGRRWHRARLLTLDHAAFEGFWQLDDTGLEDALDATPAARLRIAVDPHSSRKDPLLGYAVIGRAASRGYVQRVAVHPAAQGQGIGRALVLDGLNWLHRRGAATALVNTQERNTRALALYRGMGFVDEPRGLDVLTCQPPATP